MSQITALLYPKNNFLILRIDRHVKKRSFGARKEIERRTRIWTLWLFATPWITACQASLSITNSRNSLKLTSTESVMPSSYHPLSSPYPPALNPSQHQGLFQWVNSSHEVAKVLEFQLQHQSFQRTCRTDLLRMDWLDLLAIQGTLKSLFQHRNSKASILQCSAFFIVQLSHPYVTTGKTIALNRRTFVGKVYFWICYLGWS